MRIFGIEIKANEAIFALIDSDGNEIAFIPSGTRKLSLSDDESQEAVKLFFETIGAFFRNNGVELVAIKKRNKKGEYAGGPITFKIEGLIQMIQVCDVCLISSQTIAASNRKNNFQIPDALLRYQNDAFLTACSSTEK